MIKLCLQPGCTRPAKTGRQTRYCEPCLSQLRRKPFKYPPTPKIDALIQEAWTDPVLHGKAAGKWVQERCGWPMWKIKRRAMHLGLAQPSRRPKGYFWSDAEVVVLEQYAWMSPERIQKKLRNLCGTRRTPASINLKRKRMDLLGRGLHLEGYSARRLAALFGFDVHKVLSWIRWGWLPADRRGEEPLGSRLYAVTKERDRFYIPHQTVRTFVIEHPEEVDLHKIDKLWFIDLLVKGEIGKKTVRTLAYSPSPERKKAS